MLFVAQVTERQIERVCGEDPGFFCRKVYEWTENRDQAELADRFLGKPLTILLILLVAMVLSRLLRRGMKGTLRRLGQSGVQERVRRATPDALLETREHSLRVEQRIQALSSVLGSIVSVVVYGIALFLCLGEVGIELGPLLAGAGVLGVALGFGSQSLVKDFLSGVFILLEDQFGVGDIVDLDGQTSGTVEAVSLRTTRLRAVDGTVWHVPNGEIRRVGNKSQHWSRALLDVEVVYGTDVEKATAVIQRVAHQLATEDRAILEEPEVWGVERLGAMGIVIRLVVKTTPAAQFPVSRELRARLLQAFAQEGIETPVATAPPPELPR